ncbi:hypothetical protein [Methylobacterium nodulans]|uniref:hypothetical protein n=1 Tax=Methylobacterium nodulans TaxID=114616 RepID=UPI001FCB035A|nr:hypothetical protein [Methylobacterium nodulans]
MKKSTVAFALVALTAMFSGAAPARVLVGPAEDVQSAMQLLKSKAAAISAPSIKGEEELVVKKVPVLYFGSTR